MNHYYISIHGDKLVVDENSIDQFTEKFRESMPAFNNTEIWQKEVIDSSIYEAFFEIGSRWGVLNLNYKTNYACKGLFLLTAHILTNIYGQNPSSTKKDEAKFNSDAKMNISSKSVGDESVSFRITAMQDTGNDWLSTSNYGVKFLRLRANLIGGCVIGGGVL